jgi:hypothetical protein
MLLTKITITFGLALSNGERCETLTVFVKSHFFMKEPVITELAQPQQFQEYCP